MSTMPTCSTTTMLNLVGCVSGWSFQEWARDSHFAVSWLSFKSSHCLMSSKAAVNGWILSAVSVSKVNSHGCAPLVHMCRMWTTMAVHLWDKYCLRLLYYLQCLHGKHPESRDHLEAGGLNIKSSHVTSIIDLDNYKPTKPTVTVSLL